MRILFLLIFSLMISACAPQFVPAAVNADTADLLPPSTPVPVDDSLEPITVPISIYIVTDEGGRLSSVRTDQQLERVYADANAIWAQAGITFDVQAIRSVVVPAPVIPAINKTDLRPFLDAVDAGLVLLDPVLLHGFHVQYLGGPNGVTPKDALTFFVTDFPTVPHERAVAYQLGLVLGLGNTFEGSERLMFPASPGRMLTADEIKSARNSAQRLLESQP